jgi:ribose-phosphate pyrophosphokinase
VEGAESIRGKHVAFLASFNNPETIFEQISVIYSLPKMFIASFTLILPFFPTGTAERVDREGEIPTAVTLARILSHIPMSRGGPTGMITFDIHALQERFYFGDNITPCFETGIPLLLLAIKELPDAADVVIAYPDEGAMKRFHTFFEAFHEVVCTKVRKGVERLVTLKEGEPQGKHVVIVDDLVQSGGTLIECGKVLVDNGAKKISAFCTHGVFPNDKHERFTGSDMFENFWITDSCPQTVKRVQGKKPFKILSLAGRIAQALEF